ncbi:MAG TPA: helix-turn-helix transcriptional regulator [Flavobacteriaceae bacterium]|nr:helix-turn-helix transcriptional regulator [Flavobacteriaceae bacterium]
MKISELLRLEIKKKGYTQKKFAALIGKSATTVSNLGQGKFSPTPQTIEKMCEVLGIEIKFYAVEKVPTIGKSNQDQFRRDIEAIINKHNLEKGSSTSGFILAEYLQDCLHIFDKAVNKRDRGYNAESEVKNQPMPNVNPQRELLIKAFEIINIHDGDKDKITKLVDLVMKTL